MKKAFLYFFLGFVLIFPQSVFAVNFVETDAISLLKTDSGAKTTTGDTDVSTLSVSGLTSDDILQVYVSIYCTTQGNDTSRLWNSTDSKSLAFVSTDGGNLASRGGSSITTLFQAPGLTTEFQSHTELTEANGLPRDTGIDRPVSSYFGTRTTTTAWTGSWTLALRVGAVTSGGSCAWKWRVYKIGSPVTSAGASLPANASGWLNNNGSGSLSWSTPTSSDTGSVPTSRTINGYDLTANRTLTASDLSCVPTSTTVNGHALSSNVTVLASDILPASSAGWLEDDGAGSLSWSTPSGGGSLPADAPGVLENDGAGSLSWNATFSTLPADTEGWLRNDGTGTLTWDFINEDSMFDSVTLLLFFGSFAIFGACAFWPSKKY